MTEHRHDGFTHNIDLRLSGVTGQTFETRYPQFLFAFSDPDLTALFDPLDRAALRAKRRARTWGFISVCLIAFSLSVAAIDIVAGKEHWYEWLVLVAVLAGLFGAAIGLAGVMIAGAKDKWLRQRFLCERIRQLHFQTLVRWAPLIVDAARSGEHAEFLEQRKLRTAKFRAQVVEPSAARLAAVVNDRDKEIWLVDEMGGALPESDDAKAYLSALEELRLRHQIDYVEIQLHPDGSLIPNSPIERQKLLSNFAFICVILILILHVLALMGFAHLFITKEQKPVLHVATLVLAIFALAARTLEEGLQAGKEVERYRSYASGLDLISERMRNADSQAERRDALLELEEISYVEMVNFLKSHHEAKFVM